MITPPRRVGTLVCVKKLKHGRRLSAPLPPLMHTHLLHVRIVQRIHAHPPPAVVHRSLLIDTSQPLRAMRMMMIMVMIMNKVIVATRTNRSGVMREMIMILIL